MRNKYPGICYYCGKEVAVRKGHFEKCSGQSPYKWRVIHASCAIEQREAKAKAKLKEEQHETKL